MIKKLLLVLVLILLVGGAIVYWLFFLPASGSDKTKYLYIRTNHANKEAVLKSIEDSSLFKNPGAFEFLANRLDIWTRLKPGRYEVSPKTSLLTFVRNLRNGRQSAVNLVITKLRTKEQLASLVGRRFETDSSEFNDFLNNRDTLSKYDLDTNTVMSSVFPNTYTYFWNSDPSVIYKKLYAQYQKVWTNKRREQAKERGLTPSTAYILASIIEEETTLDSEKDTMASVYLNRLQKQMRLGADPTVKFALRDFDLRRIYEKHLAVESPYNTYRYAGLPPGPICTPSLKTLDAVLAAPKTDYLYFVAKSDFSQKHVFTASYDEHMKFAREYQKALNEYQERRASGADSSGK